MKKFAFLLGIGLLLFGSSKAQEIPFIKKEQISLWQSSITDTIYVINFWATWCKPCLEELPSFEKITRNYPNSFVKVILVSNDFKKQIDTKLVPFLKHAKIKSQVVFMDETNPNTWIEMVDPNWSGAIPATLIFKGSTGQRFFKEGTLSYDQLNTEITKLLR